MSANLRTWTETEGDELWAKKRPVLSIAAASITVSGSNMGAPVRKKTIKRKTSTFNYEATIVASQGKSLVEIETERIRLVQDLEEKLVEARQRSTKEPEPRPTMQIRFYSILQQLLRIFLSPTQKNLRKPGHVRYSEIILALLYWYAGCPHCCPTPYHAMQLGTRRDHRTDRRLPCLIALTGIKSATSCRKS